MVSTIKYVVDTSVLIQAFVEDTHTPRATTLIRLLFENPPAAEIFVPEFCLTECCNIMWKRVVFQNSDLKKMQENLRNLIVLPLTIYPTPSLMPRALEIGTQYRLAIYDSLYIALAEFLRCPLLTEDGKQADVAKAVGIQLKPITDFPEYAL